MDNLNTIPRTMELERPKNVKCPYESSYSADVVVVGCGFAGLNAAYAARKAGANVLVIDKGRPGYSGLAPFASSFRWFDPERGDVAEAYRKAIMLGSDYIANLHSFDMWINESKNIFERLTEWGILAQYPRGAEAGDFFEKEDFVGYRETYDKFDRRKKWIEVLDKNGIPWIEHTMVTDLITAEGKIKGVAALHIPSGSVITVSAKAAVLAAGGGSVKPTGFPTGGDSFDAEYMAYQLGLPIAGKEFEDFHSTSSFAPGMPFSDSHWQYLENIWLCGGDITPEGAEGYAVSKGNAMLIGRVKNAVYGIAPADTVKVSDVAQATYTRRGGSCVYDSDPEELRSGKMTTPTMGGGDAAGGAIGMCCHLVSGIFTGLYDSEGKTEIAGLYAAGDGTRASCPSGAAYPCGVGFTSCFCSIDGDHAGKAAALFAAGKESIELTQQEMDSAKESILAPMNAKQGFDPVWARDVLHSIMAPYWVSVAKTEETLRAALVQVEYMRDHVIPRLIARSGHDLAICIEMKHKILACELKLRAGLERRESRGSHYRSDIPYRDDDYLCCITVRKGGNGEKIYEKHALPDEWTGDKNLPYNKRYKFYFPGEPEAKGFKVETRGGWGGRK